MLNSRHFSSKILDHLQLALRKQALTNNLKYFDGTAEKNSM